MEPAAGEVCPGVVEGRGQVWEGAEGLSWQHTPDSVSPAESRRGPSVTSEGGGVSLQAARPASSEPAQCDPIYLGTVSCPSG